MGTKHMPHHFSKERKSGLEEIGDYMSSSIISVESDAMAKEAARLMQTHHIGSILVKKDGEFVGILTESDLSRKIVARGLDPETTPVAEIMVHPIHCLDRSEQVDKANIFMASKKIRHLGVMENGKIVGILSIKDLVSYFSNPRMRTW